MKCKNCDTENPASNKFCRNCGTRFVTLCPSCNAEVAPDDSFCGECGICLNSVTAAPEAATLDSPPDESPAMVATANGDDRVENQKEGMPPRGSAGGERKQVTVLFSDLAGFTAMSEALDPEEIKNIMSRIFGEAAQIVAKYNGHIDKFIGDAVMVLFGVPQSNEDDPTRAIRSAIELHEYVRTLSAEVEDRIGRPLAMHSGINTGMVVTGEIDLQKGTERVLGDSINVASRLTELASAGEIYVGEETYHQSEGYFDFREIDAVSVKGKAAPLRPYRVLSMKEKPITIHHLSGLRAKLVGREIELGHLSEAIERLHRGVGTIVAICGEGGTGKSRLIDEFKSTLDLDAVQWREAYAYSFSQNMPYFQLKDLFSRAWGIEESDTPEVIREKVAAGISEHHGTVDEIAPFIGSLYDLEYPVLEGMGPQFRKIKLHEAVRDILSALCKRAPAVIFLEDLHWSDPSSAELLRSILSDFTYPAVFVCAYRPGFTLLTDQQKKALGDSYRELQLHGLSSSEILKMMESLLETSDIPTALHRTIQEKIEGNPFYLEEIINSLTETGVLQRENDTWVLAKKITDFDVPTTIHGVITARLDHLDVDAKRIIQEASVIGRTFFYDILERVSELGENLKRYLSNLEMMDLIRTQSLQPDLEFIFKHALTQEVVYNSILKEDRLLLHEKIAVTIESLFPNRLQEFYETLAYHYSRGHSVLKAVDYLLRSAEKSLERYSVEESHQYCNEAYDILLNMPAKTRREDELLIDLICQWAMVQYYRGNFEHMSKTLETHRILADSLPDDARKGLFYAWFGFSLFMRSRSESYEHLRTALRIGEAHDDNRVIGLACSWLSFACYERTFLDEGIEFGERAREIGLELKKDQYIYFKSLNGISYNYWVKGDRNGCYDVGKTLVEYGEQHTNVRSVVVGYIAFIIGHHIDGDLNPAIELSKKALSISVDPFYDQWCNLSFAWSLLETEKYNDALQTLNGIDAYCRANGCEQFGYPVQFGLGVTTAANGSYAKGINAIKRVESRFVESKREFWHAVCEHALGRIYLQLAVKSEHSQKIRFIRNIGFIATQAPFAAGRCERHFRTAISISDNIGSKFYAGRSYRDLATLYIARKKYTDAKRCLEQALMYFEVCNAETRIRDTTAKLAEIDSI